MKKEVLYEDIYYLYKEIQIRKNYSEIKVVYKNFKDYCNKNNLYLEKDRDGLIYFEGKWYSSISQIKEVIYNRFPFDDLGLVINNNIYLLKNNLRDMQKGKCFFVWRGQESVFLFFSYGEEIMKKEDYSQNRYRIEKRYGKPIIFETTYKSYSISRK